MQGFCTLPLLIKITSQRENIVATLPDTVLNSTSYINLNTSTGLITGTPLAIQNKGTAFVRIIISPTQPSASSVNGSVIEPFKFLYIQNETDIVWGKATENTGTPVSVQQIN
jgi:hypothetical protein